MVTSLTPETRNTWAVGYYKATLDALRLLDEETLKNVSVTMVPEVIQSVQWILRQYGRLYDLTYVIDTLHTK